MNNPKQSLESGAATINGQPVGEMRGVMLDYRTLEIFLHGRAAIRIYAFNSLMLSSGSKRRRSEEYVLDGPKLGHYYDSADIREGPYVSHLISHLEISIAYHSTEEAHFHIRGTADLSKSLFDPSWYKGPTTGEWNFDVSFVHKFARHEHDR